MKLYKLTKRGFFHENHNEDYLLFTKIGEQRYLLSVLDGCSNGIESHFASNLAGKILRRIAKELDYIEFVEKKEKPLDLLLKEITKLLFEWLNKIKNQLDLNKYELLSTVILGIIEINSNSAELLVLGDGLIYYDGNLVEYGQDNRPDYLGYHLQEDFNDWYERQEQRLSLNQIYDLSISTDGIFSFQEFSNRKPIKKSEMEIIEYLLKNKENKESENMLQQRIFEIENKWKLMPSDDLSIIRVLLNDK